MNVASPVAYLSEGLTVNKTPHPTPDLVVASQDVLLQALGLLFNIWDATYSRMTCLQFNSDRLPENTGLGADAISGAPAKAVISLL